MKQPPLTRVHALAIMDPRHDLLVVDGDNRLTATSSSTFLGGASGRIVLTRGDLLDHGVALAGDGRRFAAGSGLIVDQLLDAINDVR
ncbi:MULTISPECIES: hypothetical protein [Mycobacteriaceae]|uniref:Uncharacterized protein n=1 Tax=Mycolicibacterium nivoides TaxID=2487344 RepID=A0ABW9LK02_9MYCO|nr:MULTISPECIES: hypothetical protein [Mycobacteriaceae]